MAKLSIKIVGAGGIGSWAALLIAAEAYVKYPGARIEIIDGDQFTPANELRQGLFYKTEGTSYKGEAAWYELHQKYGKRVNLRWRDEYINRNNAYALITDGDIVVLCVDNHESRHIASIRCQDLDDVVLISSGNIGTIGHVLIHRREDGVDLTPPIHRNHLDIATAKLVMPQARVGCGNVVATDEQVLSTNIAVAHEVFHTVRRIVEKRCTETEIWLDVAKGTRRTVQ